MFYDRFVEICKEHNVLPSQVAIKCGFNKSSVTNWKKNGYAPRQEILKKIADYFNVSVDYLLSETKNPSIDSDKGVSEYTVVAMNGTPGAHEVKVKNEAINKMAELLQEVNDLSPEKIDMLIKIVKSIK